MDKNIRPYIAELVGTFALVFVSAGAVCTAYLTASAPANGGHMQLTSTAIIGVALAQGLVLVSALAATVPVSGGYLNPAITLMLYVFKRFELGKTLMLILVQFLGAVLAGGLLRVIFGGLRENLIVEAQLGTPHVNLESFGVGGIGPRVLFSGLGVELVLTFILAAVIFATYYDPRVPRLLGRLGAWLSPLWVGLINVALVLVGLSWTGAALNPIRYFGTAIWEQTVPSLADRGVFSDHMVYWIGPVLGALLAGAAYIYLILPEQEEPLAAPSITTSKRPTASSLSRK